MNRSRRRGKSRKQESSPEVPLRAELFSGEQLRRHAVALAGQHRLATSRGPNRLLSRLAENEQVLLDPVEKV